MIKVWLWDVKAQMIATVEKHVEINGSPGGHIGFNRVAGHSILLGQC